jgi:signal peptide peptidase SppA
MRSDFWTWYFGGTSYESIRQDFRAALDDSEVENIIFEIDSPGGEVSGVFGLVDEIKAARGQKKIIAVINEMAYSAAYAIASAADEIYIPRTGGAGSIGVIAIHTDISKMDDMAGIKYTPIYAGARKNDFTPHEPLSKESYAVVKAEVDDIYNLFIDTVANNRGLPSDTIKNMEAGIYQGQKAIDAGLADKISSLENIITTRGGNDMGKKLIETLQSAIKGLEIADISEAMEALGYVLKEGMISVVEHEEKIAAKTTEYDKILQESKIEAKEAAIKETKAGILEILDLCAVGNMPQLGLKMVTDGISKEDARKQIMEAQASNQNINSTVNPLNSGETNPLLADAKKRAKEVK